MLTIGEKARNLEVISMKKAFTTFLFFVLVCGTFALSSNTNTAVFTLDIVAPAHSLSSLSDGETGSAGDTDDFIECETLGWCTCQHLGLTLIITGR